MKYGFCTGFATNPLFSMNIKQGEKLISAGYDYVEYPLFAIAALSESEFQNLVSFDEEKSIRTTISCNFFPSNIKLFTKTEKSKIETYLDLILPRAKKLGITKIIFGSGPARMLPNNLTKMDADIYFSSILKEIILPRTSEYGIKVLIEPLNRDECNYLNTIIESADFVKQLNSPNLGLMIDIYHMMLNGENTDDIKTVFPLIEHVHIAEKDRNLPENNFSEYSKKALEILKSNGYNNCISYECNTNDFNSNALMILKEQLR